MSRKETDVKNVKQLFLMMYEEFPDTIFRNQVEKVFHNTDVIVRLVEDHYLCQDISFESERERTVGYYLGPAALPLVSAWKNEEFSRNIMWLTVGVIIIATASIVLSVISII